MLEKVCSFSSIKNISEPFSMTPTIINTTTTKHRRLNSSRRWAGLWFILPCMVFVTVFFLAPLVMTLWMSLHDWPLLGKSSFIGFENYISLASDTTFWNSLWFTTKYTLVVTPVIFLLAFGLALLVQSRRRMVGWFRAGEESNLWVLIPQQIHNSFSPSSPVQIL